MIPTRPYLIRAFYDWILDNQLTPYLLIDAEGQDVAVPEDYVEDGKIVLNISSSAANNLQMGNQAISFNARFSGVEQNIVSPVRNVLAIYAKENGRGMVFSPEDEDWGDEDDGGPDGGGGDGGGDGGQGPGGPGGSDGSGGSDGKPPKPTGKRPKLTVVK